MSDPHPPGEYPIVVVGSGPGGLQMAYALSRLGLDYAHLSSDDSPGGMFRMYPIFQRLISWTKPHAPVDRGTRDYERYDWNSLIAQEPDNRDLVAAAMDGTSYFPSRPEMEAGLAAFATGAGLAVRYGCRWEGTRREDDRIVLETSHGEYRCRVAIFAIGMTEPWKPDIAGIEHVPHYVQVGKAEDFAGKRVFIMGKRNSGFEIADGLLPWARQIILGSPRPTALSVITRSLVGARARYAQPYEDYVLAGGNVIVDAAIDRIERTGSGYRVHAKGTTRTGDYVFEVDEVIAATGFQVPLRDLAKIGVATFMQGRLPAQTPWWESASAPGIYFAGSVTQGSIGMKKYGIPGTSAAVHGFRYNAGILARHLARKHFGVVMEREAVPRDRVADHLLEAATHAPELWNQRSYLAESLEIDEDGSVYREGVVPLAHFVDAPGPDAVAITVETDSQGDIHPAVYVRSAGRVEEHLLPSAPLHDYVTAEHRSALRRTVTHLRIS